MEKKEKRIRDIALSYYSRKDVLNAIFNFSKEREVVPKYFEGFGKRPDSFQYPADIISLVKNGATSFHCSEEIWEDPFQISTELNQEQLNNLRKGWDLIIDIDCSWIDYSKKAAQAIIKALEFKGVKNISIKFSGNKGFHIIVPWEAFPDEIDGIKTKEMFPAWPRAIIGYLKEISRPILEDLIKDMKDDFSKVKGFTGVKCESCNNLADENFQITLRCPKCYPPHIETFKTSQEEYKKRKCPNCFSMLEESKKEKFYFCKHCDLNSITNKNNFKNIISVDIFKVLGLDVLLVSPRHLFRMPYSLHEKTSLASVVIDRNKINEFNLKDADSLNVKVVDFMPNVKKNEAKELLLRAIDWQKLKEKSEPIKSKPHFHESGQRLDDKELRERLKALKDGLKDEYFPPAILKILKGMEDGKKRALFILMNFFRSLGIALEDIEKRLNEWNKLNNPPLKQGYINSQLIWHSKNKIVLPPNFDNEIYKAIGVYEIDDLSMKVKNPVNYVLKKAGIFRRKKWK